MPWERPPSWLYLPHLLPVHADSGGRGDAEPCREANQDVAGGQRNGREQHEGAWEPEGRNGGQEAATSQRLQGDKRMPREETPRGQRTSHDTIERMPQHSSGGARCSIDGKYVRVDTSASVRREEGMLASEAARDTTTARMEDEVMHAIRGRGLPLGPNGECNEECGAALTWHHRGLSSYTSAEARGWRRHRAEPREGPPRRC